MPRIVHNKCSRNTSCFYYVTSEMQPRVLRERERERENDIRGVGVELALPGQEPIVGEKQGVEGPTVHNPAHLSES